MMNHNRLCSLPLILLFVLILAISGRADDKPKSNSATPDATTKLYSRDNLVAWCIVPFDAKKRGPVERVAMLERLGFRHYAYDWRDEHLPTFETEILELKKRKIELTSIWFPGLDDNGKKLLEVLKKHDVKTQLWVTGGGGPTFNFDERKSRIAAEADRIRPIAEAAAVQGCTVGLYNHGGWFGEPENQIAIIKELNLTNVGIVYNLHHGHSQLERFPQLLKLMMPHLYIVNLNGMIVHGDEDGRKIMPLGTGLLDLWALKTIRDSGYRGPIGILGHTNDDAEERLRDNLDGLDWLLPQLAGEKPGPLPTYRTPIPKAVVPTSAKAPPPPPPVAAPAIGQVLVAGKFEMALDARAGQALSQGSPEFRDPPLSVECWAKLYDPRPFNILMASEPKSSGTHWELFTFAGTGRIAVYLPGMNPDHIHSEAVVTDGKWHHIGFLYEAKRGRLFVDGKQVANVAIESRQNPARGDGFAIGSLVNREIGCVGMIDEVRLSRGLRDFTDVPKAPLTADEQTLGLWRFDKLEKNHCRDSGKLGQSVEINQIAR